ncbi:MAG: PQQ-binding-like beta-propeller repeat protein [Thermodesulfobacteriota bacterium]
MKPRSIAPRRAVLATLLALAVAGACSDRPGSGDGREHAFLSRTPYPAQHVNPRNADYVEADAPAEVAPVWTALADSTVPQPCVSGDGGLVYCMRAWDLASDRCNLQALDLPTGALRWEDRVDGRCQLDDHAWMTNPLVDVDGNVYVADSRQVLSFDRAGRLRWRSDVPSTLVSRHDPPLPNQPFGLTVLPSGELVTATLGDAYVLVLERDTGELAAEPLDVPSAKRRTGGEPPPGFFATLASPVAARTLYDVSLGFSEYENDNNVGVDTHTGLILVTGGAPAPNPGNDGALWAVRFDRDAPGGPSLAVQFHVPFPGPGGIATTPTLTKDGQFVLIGDNESNLVAVDLPACAALPAGSVCDAIARAPVETKLGASVTVTPENRVLVSAAAAGVLAFDVGRRDGQIFLDRVFLLRFSPYLVSGVLTGFANLTWFPIGSPGTGEHYLVAIDTASGEERSRLPAGDFANVTMGEDGATLITNQINFLEELAGRHGPAGVTAWRAPAR